MKSVYIKINEIKDVYTLVNSLVAYDGDVDLEQGRYKVDGKSLLGIFSLDLRQPIKLSYNDEDNSEVLFAAVGQFIVDAPEA